jgi:methyl-accepting chemotaxis protein
MIWRESLQARLLFLLIGMLLVLVVMSSAVHRWVLLPSFVALEQHEADKDLQRVVEAIQQEFHHLNHLASDWAAWDDAYQYAQDHNAGFVASNLQSSSFAGTRLSLMYFYDPQGMRIWGNYFDRNLNGFRDWTELPEQIGPEHRFAPFLRHEDPKGGRHGLFMSAFGPLLMVSRPIVTSGYEGPIRGTLLMGRLLDPEMIRAMAEQLHVVFEVWPVSSAAIPAVDRAMLQPLEQGQPAAWRTQADGQALAGYALFRDLFGAPALLVRATIQRDILRKGEETELVAMGSIVVVGVLMMAGLYWFLSSMVVRPLLTLQRHVVMIRESGNLTARVQIQRMDEIGLLADSFNAMMESFTGIVRTLRLHVHSLDACVDSLDDNKQRLEGDAWETRTLSHGMLDASRGVDSSMEQIHHEVEMTTGEVVSLSVATDQLSAGFVEIARSTERVSDRIRHMADAAGEIHRHIGSVQGSLEQVEQSVHAVGHSVSEVTHALENVRLQSEQARESSNEAKRNTHAASAVMARLAAVVTEISDVVRVINKIAEQTQMLAINAAIESVRAGEAGAGFSIVASEVRELAAQTANATSVIARHIADIQRVSHEAELANQQITGSIDRISEGSMAIFAAVEQQNRTARTIVRSLEDVSVAAGEVGDRMQDLHGAGLSVAGAAADSAHDMESIAGAVHEASQQAIHLAERSRELDASAGRMRTAVMTGMQTGARAQEHIEGIFSRIDHLSERIRAMAFLVTMTAVPGRRLQDATDAFDTGPDPFDAAAVKRACFRVLDPLQGEAGQEPGGDVLLTLVPPSSSPGDAVLHALYTEVRQLADALYHRTGREEPLLGDALLGDQLFDAVDRYYLELYRQ